MNSLVMSIEQRIPSLVFVEHSTALTTSMFNGLSRAVTPDSSSASAVATVEECMADEGLSM